MPRNDSGSGGIAKIWKYTARVPRRMMRIRELMTRYRDVPMDFADASLVALAESMGEKRVFTLDNDFYAYRLYDSEPFDVIAPRGD